MVFLRILNRYELSARSENSFLAFTHTLYDTYGTAVAASGTDFQKELDIVVSSAQIV